jgi:hypothetical protein
MAGIRIEGNTSGNVVEVTGSNQLKVITETNVSTNPGNVGGIRAFYENDAGDILGTATLLSPEVDDDYRVRVALDHLLDTETFNYTAQNTGKHTYTTTTMTAVWGTSGLRTNGTAITTTTTGMTMGTYAEFPIFGGQALYLEMNNSFDNDITTNFNIDFGLFRRGGSTPFAPTDGVYFRVNASGFIGIINYNSSETNTGVFDFTVTPNKKYKFVISFNERNVEFWIDNVLYATLDTPIGQGQPCLSATLPISVRHANTGTAGAALSMYVNNYVLHSGGYTYARSIGEVENAMLGSYQGLSGGTMGQLIAGTVTTGTLVKPTAAVPLNASLAANLPNNLGGRAFETLTSGLAINTDGILAIYQNPAGTISIQGKRLRITGLKLSAAIQTVIAGGPITNEFYLIFGGTAASLQTVEGIAAKPCRRIMLPEFTQNITATQAANTAVQQASYFADFSSAPIYVNPSEFVGIAVNRFGTALTSGVIAYTYQFVYSWE